MDNTQSKRENKMKKKELDDESSSDSDTSLHDLRCDICDVNFSSLKSYSAHMKGKRHQKTAAEAKLLSKLALSDKEKKDDNESDDDDDSNEMHCDVCNRYMSGSRSYMTHLKGSLHAKNIKKQKLKEGMKGMPEVLEKENEESNENDDEILQNLFARCDTCQKSFSGPEPFHMHLKSSAHKKKVQQSKMLESLKTKHADEASKSDDEDCFSKCSVCNKSFSGPKPYIIHMDSNVHKKNVEKMKLIEEVKEFFSTDENAYVCKECDKKFTDPKNFKYHLTNNSHEKRKAKKALSEFLASNPEITFVTPFKDNDSGDENDSYDSDEDYYLICKICHVSFSGPASAEDHVKSKRHISLKKEKKKLKILKKQKKDANNSSDVNDKKEVSRGSDTGDVEKTQVESRSSTNGETSQPRGTRLPSEDDFELL